MKFKYLFGIILFIIVIPIIDAEEEQTVEEKFDSAIQSGDYSQLGSADWKNPKVDFSKMKVEDIGKYAKDIEASGRAAELTEKELEGNLLEFDNPRNLNQNEMNAVLQKEPYSFQGSVDIASIDSGVEVKFNNDYQLVIGSGDDANYVDSGTNADQMEFSEDGDSVLIVNERESIVIQETSSIKCAGADRVNCAGEEPLKEESQEREDDFFDDIPEESLEQEALPTEPTSESTGEGAPEGDVNIKGQGMNIGPSVQGGVVIDKAEEVVFTPLDDLRKALSMIHAEEVSIGSQGMFAEKAEIIQSGDTTVSNAENVFVSNTGEIYLESASVVNDLDSITIEPKEYISNQVYFSVKSADSVEVGCYKYYNVSDARFNVENGNTIMELAEDNTVPIENCYENIFFFTAQSNESQITVIPGTPDILLIKAGMISYEDESVEINSTAMVLFDPITGVVCMEVNPPATYYKNDLDMRKDFAVYMYQDSYKLCFKKTISDNHAVPTTEYNYGLVDFLDNAAYLNGYAQYLRYPFSSTVTDLSYKNIYDGQLDDSKTIINLDNDGLFINTMNVVNNSGITSISNPAEYITIIEDHTTSWVKLSHKQILSNNIAHIYNLAAVKGNILSRGNTQIYPYRNVVMEDYIDSLNIKEENLGVFG